MPVLEKIAYYQHRRDEIPNLLLARELARGADAAGVAELAENLWHANPGVQSDCLKVLYEVGYLAPQLIAGRVDDFLRLLDSKNNRLVWGAMIALAAIAPLRPARLFAARDVLLRAVAAGSVITIDNGVRALAAVAARGDEYRAALLPFLFDHLKTCRAKDVPAHAESIAPAVDAPNLPAFTALLERRLTALTPAQAARVTRLIRSATGA